MSEARPYVMHVLSHTHWDREWYQPFQGYRRRLVFQMDALMDLLERRRRFRCFHLDGQTAVLDDYLEIKPQGRDRLARHLRSGRVLVGPWYTMPDEAHLGGESLIGNLLLGHRRCREWGVRPMPIGWVSDVFSHVSQMPQILRGFGLDCAFLHHGTPCTQEERSEMVWEGADGTETLLLKAYPWFGYQDVLQMRYRTPDELRDYERKKIALATTNVLLGLDGNDHEPAKWDTPEVIARLNALFARTRVVHSALPEYLAALRRALGPNWQRGRKRFVGELRTPVLQGNWNGLTNGTGSSRLPLKQANDALEILLSRLAEPLNAWAFLRGGEPQRDYLDRAWRYLFLNHPHDSICGCSIDQAHRDMAYRFDQARLIATDSIHDGLQTLAESIAPAAFAGGDYAVTVLNPGVAPTGPVTVFSFDLPSPVVARKAGQGLSPVLLDDAGQPLACDVLRVEREVRAEPLTYKVRGITPAIWVKRDHPVHRYHVAAAARIPALGYRCWRVGFRPTTPVRRAPGLRVRAARGVLANELVRLVARPDGRVDLYDHPTRTWFRGLHAFEDGGDAGDGWNHVCPTRDTVVRSTNSGARGRVRVSLDRHGPLCASMRIAFSLRIPADLVAEAAAKSSRERITTRSRRLVALPIETVFTLRAGSRRVDCRTTVDNRARCHRLRAVFPTRRQTDVWFGDTAFDTVRRSIRLRDTRGWAEQDREECPIKNFAAACDRRAGLAVLTRGLYEAAVRDNPQRSIAVTLFRGFVERLLFENTADSLLPGPLAMEYALLPFSPERGEPPVGIYASVDDYKLPLPSDTRPASGAPVDEMPLPPRSEQNPPQPAPPVGAGVIPLSAELAAILRARPRPARDLPASATLLEISAPLVLSTVKRSEDGRAIIVRAWNPAARAAKAAVRTSFAFKRAFTTNLLEQPQVPLRPAGRTVRLSAKPKKILTVRFEL